MLETWNRYKNSCFELLTCSNFVTLLCLVIIAGYGILIVHPTVNWDFSLYKGDTGLVASTFFLMGRWGASLLAVVAAKFAPGWNEVFACCLLFWATLTWCTLWQLVSRGKISITAQILFALLFVSYPLNHEIYLYPLAFPGICCGYLATGLSLIWAYEFWDNRRWSVVVTAIFFQAFAISVYQTFAVVYLCGVFAVLMVSYIFRTDQSTTLSANLMRTLGYIGVLIGAMALWFIIAKLPRLIFHVLAFPIPKTGGAADEIAWLTQDVGFFAHVGQLVKGLIYNFIYASLFYEALRFFLLSAFVVLVFSLIWSVRKRSWTPVYLAAGLVGANFALSLIQGIPTYYRACQSFALFVGVIWMALYSLLGRHVRVQQVVVVMVAFLVLFQSRDLSLWFYNNYRRFEMDKNNFQTMVNKVESKFGRDISKPIVVVGEVPPYRTLRNDEYPFNYLPSRYGPGECNGKNRFSAVGIKREFYLFAKHVCGFVCVLPTPEQVAEAEAVLKQNQQPAWPLEGYIREYDQYIIVNLNVKAPSREWLDKQTPEMYLSESEKQLFHKLHISGRRKGLHDRFEKIYKALQ